jgi:hypothetical protein
MFSRLIESVAVTDLLHDNAVVFCTILEAKIACSQAKASGQFACQRLCAAYVRSIFQTYQQPQHTGVNWVVQGFQLVGRLGGQCHRGHGNTLARIDEFVNEPREDCSHHS